MVKYCVMVLRWRRWAEYFMQELNVADDREANINVVGNWRMLELGDLNERAISIEEVREATNEIKSGKVPVLDGFLIECLKKVDGFDKMSS